jgi:uncharacterized membrane protein
MDEFVVSLTEHYLKPTLELIGIFIVLLGVLLALFRFALFLFGSKKYPSLEQIQLDLIHYLMVGLTIQVGADILSTAVNPTLTDLGVLAGIAVVRAGLSYFLSKDQERGLEATQAKPREDEKGR